MDAFRAGALAALANEVGGAAVVAAFGELTDLFVDLSEEGFVAGRAFLGQAHHYIFASAGLERNLVRAWHVLSDMSVRELAIESDRSDEVRAGNDRIAERAEQLRFVSRVPMLCECGQPGCSQMVLIGLDEYRSLRADGRRYLTAPDHRLEAATVETKQPGYWQQRR